MNCTIILLWHCFIIIRMPKWFVYAAIPVTIGLRRSLYYVNEDTGSLVVCYDVLSGRTATRSISMQMRTVQGDAIG